MGTKCVSLIFTLHLLLVLCARESGAGKMAARKQLTEFEETNVISMVVDRKDNMVHEHAGDNSSSHMNHMDPALMVFFTFKDLQVGKRMPVYFPKRDPLTSPPLLHKQKADAIPFSLKKLPYILQYFSFSPGSPQAKAIEDTLKECENHPIKGETKFCATSLESMLGFTHEVFQTELSNLKVLTTTHLTKSTIHFQNYTMMEIAEEIGAPKLVSCHTMPYPYEVLYCHYQESKNMVFKVLLVGENRDRVDALAVCHFDTSHWGKDHASFRVLGIKPGTDPVCHFFPADNFVWVPKKKDSV